MSQYTHKTPISPSVLNSDDWFTIFILYCEWPMLQIPVHILVVNATTDQPFHIENSVLRVGVERRLSSVANTRFMRC